jgi:LytS/YehU family sensor histidine kinase
MNPHFIFNVLNSIQFFIAKNDRQNAINYLSTFSKLIRTVLTHSVAEKIKLTDELDMLRNYIELEKVRFEDKFTYKVEIDEDVEVNNILIPSLLIQPYIENAILHGLYNKVGQGQLTIRVKTDDEFLNFEIEDDGVGREEAARIRATNKADHKSMGTKLTEERLRAINQHKGTDVLFEDLFRGSDPAGTKVTIKVKFN